jgi:Spy/CpxP family protein refolding chaperone
MKNFSNKILATLLTLFCLGTAFHNAPSYAQHGKGRRMMHDLGLDETQRASIKEIREKYKTQSAGLDKNALRSKKEELKKGLAGTASKESLKSLYQEIKALREARSEMRFNQMLEIRDVLKPEQRQKLAEKFEKREGKGRHKHKKYSSEDLLELEDVE